MFLSDTRWSPSVVNKMDGSNMSALFLALEWSDLPIIQLLMDFHDIEVNNRNDRGDILFYTLLQRNLRQ